MSGTVADVRSNNVARRVRRKWLLETYRADVDLGPLWFMDHSGNQYRSPVPLGMGEPACRCFRCGQLLTIDTLTVDRVLLGRDGGRYHRENIRPACRSCNCHLGGKVRRRKEKK